MGERKTIVLVLRSGGDFSMKDVELIVRHINGKWKSVFRPRILCMYDKATQHYDLGNFEIIPLRTNQHGTWSRIEMYGPSMEQYRPFLYIDLDTAVIQSVEKIFALVKDPSQFITLEDFWQKGELATGLVWVPANSEKVTKIWEGFIGGRGSRMDRYIRNVVRADAYWQNLTKSVYDFKPRHHGTLIVLPEDATLVCFHGKPRIFEAEHISWVRTYINAGFSLPLRGDHSVTVIIPYNKDRGWLKEAISSVPEGVQLLISQGPGNWPENFNKVLDQAEGDYVRWLHEDDMLTENCIEDSVKALEEQNADFIHGNAYEIFVDKENPLHLYRPKILFPTLQDLLQKNVMHSATMMYRRSVFEKVGFMDETLNTAEEFEFNLRCLRAGLKLGYCDKPLAYYRRHPGQKVRVVPVQDKNKEREQVRAMYK